MARITKNRSLTSFHSLAALSFRPTIMAVIASSLTMAARPYYGVTAPAETSIRRDAGSVSSTLARVILKPNRARILLYTAQN